jgi:uncharacterized damage-inducible protein DinB
MYAHHRIEALDRQFRHEAWADVRMHAALSGDSPPERAVSLWNELMANKRRWLERVSGAAEEAASEDAAAAIPAPAAAGAPPIEDPVHTDCRFQALLASIHDIELTRLVTFHGAKGAAQADTLGDILHHLLLEGADRRARIALLLEDAGIEPPPVDFIGYARDEHPDPRDSRRMPRASPPPAAHPHP